MAGSRFDTLRAVFAKCQTKADFDSSLHQTFSEFRVEHSGETFTRDIDFGHRQSAYHLMIFYGKNHVEEYRAYLILDSLGTIVLGTLQLLAEENRVLKGEQFNLDRKWLSKYTKRHCALYGVSLNEAEVIEQLTQLIVYGSDCGFSGGGPPYGKKMKSFVESSDIEHLSQWLRQVNAELQAFGAIGLLQIQEKGVQLPKEDMEIIQHLKQRNSEIYSCGGCIYGLTFPLGQFLSRYEH